MAKVIEENIYKFFDLDKNATEEEISKSFRKKIKKLHPDLNKKENNVEYEKAILYKKILLDPKSREDYDNGNYTTEEKLSAIDIILKMFGDIILNPVSGFFKVDILLLLKKNIKQEKEECLIQNKNCGKTIKDFKNIQKRLKVKTGDNIFNIYLDSEIKKLKNIINENDRFLLILADCLTILDNYEYNFESNDPKYNSSFKNSSISFLTGADIIEQLKTDL